MVVSSSFIERENAASALPDHEWRPRHAFHAAGKYERKFAALDAARRVCNRLHARAAESIDGHAGHIFRQSCQKQRHAADVAIILARLVRAAVDHIIERRPIDFRVALDKRANRQRRQIVSANRGKRSTIAPERSSHRIANISLIHFVIFSQNCPGSAGVPAGIRRAHEPGRATRMRGLNPSNNTVLFFDVAPRYGWSSSVLRVRKMPAGTPALPNCYSRSVILRCSR